MLLVSDTTEDAIEDLQKQINKIVDELSLLKEQQALQSGKTHTGGSWWNNSVHLIKWSSVRWNNYPVLLYFHSVGVTI